MAHIAFWHGIVSNSQAELFKKFANSKAVLQALINNDYSKIHLAKKHSDNKEYPIYSCTITNAGRLLFTTVNVRGKPYILPLEELPTHNYEDSKFLRNKSLLISHVEKHAAKDTVITEHDFIPLTEEEKDQLKMTLKSGPRRVREIPSAAVAPIVFEPEEEEAPLIHLPITFYNNNFIQLDQKQTDTLYYKLPLMVGGLPGSGKSCLAMTMLSQWVAETVDTETPLLYITKSKRLAENLEAQWNDLPKVKRADGKEPPQVLFKTYDELLTEKAVINANKLVGKEHYIAWYKSRKRAFSLENLYQEFGMCSPFKTIEDYQAFGKQNLLHAAPEDRAKIWDLYQLYRKKLEAEGLVHPPFYIPESLGKYQKVVVDEAQDLFPLQLEALALASENEALVKQDKEVEAAIQGPAAAPEKEVHKRANIVYFIDTHQSLTTSKSVRPFIRTLFNKEGENNLTETQLAGSYRCPEAVKNFANILIQLKNNTVGSITDKYEMTEILAPDLKQEKGQVNWFNTKELWEKGKKDILNQYLKANVVIVALEEHLQEAKEKFPDHSQIFTPEQIKGLEYELVIVYKPLTTSDFRHANTKLGDRKIAAENQGKEKIKEVSGRSMNNTAPEFATPFNNFFTSVTRATKGLVIIQDEKSLENIVNPLKESIKPQDAKAKAAPAPIITEEQEEQAWYERVKTLLKTGEPASIEVARKIFRNELHQSEEAFQVFTEALKQRKLPISKQVLETKLTTPRNHSQSLSLPADTEVKEEIEPTKQSLKPTTTHSNYVNNLFNKFTRKNLTELFQKPISLIIEILFDTPFEQGVSLISELRPDKLRVLGEILVSSNAKYLRKFIENESGLNALKKMLDRHAELLLHIQPIHLLKSIESDDVILLDKLNRTQVGTEIIAKIQRFTPNLAREIREFQVKRKIESIQLPLNQQSVADLCEYLFANPKDTALKLFCMVKFQQGRDILIKMLELDPSISKKIHVNDLFPTLENSKAVLTVLKLTEDGSFILKLLYKQHPQLMLDVLKKQRQAQQLDASLPAGALRLDSYMSPQAMLNLMMFLEPGQAIYFPPYIPLDIAMLVIKMLKPECRVILSSEIPLSVVKEVLSALTSEILFSYVGSASEDFLKLISSHLKGKSFYIVKETTEEEIVTICTYLKDSFVLLDPKLSISATIKFASLNSTTNLFEMDKKSDGKQIIAAAAALKSGGVFSLKNIPSKELNVIAAKNLRKGCLFIVNIDNPHDTLTAVISQINPLAHLYFLSPKSVEDENKLLSLMKWVKPNTTILLTGTTSIEFISRVKKALSKNVIVNIRAPRILDFIFNGVEINDLDELQQLNILMELPPPYITPEEAALKVSSLPHLNVLELHPDFSVEVYKSAISALPRDSMVRINKKTSMEKANILAKGLKDKELLVHADMPGEMMISAIRNLPPGVTINFIPQLSSGTFIISTLRKAVAALKSGYIPIHSFLSNQYIKAIVESLSNGSHITFYPDITSEKIRIAATFLSKNGHILFQGDIKKEDCEFVARTLGPTNFIRIHNSFSIETLRATAAALKRGTLSFRNDSPLDLITAAAEFLNPGTQMFLFQNFPFNTIKTVLQLLKPGTQLLLQCDKGPESAELIKMGEEKGVMVTCIYNKEVSQSGMGFFGASSAASETPAFADIPSP